MNTGSAKAYFRKDFKNKENKHPVYLRVKVKGRTKKYSLDIWLKESEWNEKKSEIRSSVTDAFSKNKYIANELERAKSIIPDCITSGGDIDFDLFDTLFKGGQIKGKELFSEFAKNALEERRHQYSKEYFRNYKSEISKLDKYKKGLLINEMNLKFVLGYEKYMVEVLGNKPNTVGKTMKRLKTLLAIAKQNKIIDENPFDSYKIKRAPTNRMFLTIDELNSLYALYKSNGLKEYYQKILRYFLFSCYTGLRYTDVLNLKKKNIQGDMLSIEMHKTKKEVRIPITEKARELLPNDLSHDDQTVFKVATNQVVNRVLKEIMSITGIKKEITFHCARHTFATIALTLGIRIEVVSDLLGHNDLKITKVYAKIIDDLRKEEMQKFNF